MFIPVYRLAAIALLVSVVGLASGGLEYAHNLTHAAEDQACGGGGDGPDGGHSHHDATDCLLHAHLHAPLASAAPAPPPLFQGLADLALPPQVVPRVSSRVPARLDCRGPPSA